MRENESENAHSETPEEDSGRDVAGISREEFDRLLALKHRDPHSILGAHPADHAVVVRTYRPEAEEIYLLIDGKTRRRMKHHEGDIFALTVEGRREIFPYLLEIRYHNNEVYTVRDPYSFAPSLGELDLYLWAQETHERVYEKLGAHVREMEGVSGVSFAVWAPNAAGVSVVGNFNSWDGRLHMMRELGSSGVWELFVPELGPGTVYKYEIRPREGLQFLKSDPFASATEVPPATASVTYESRYEFGDSRWRSEQNRIDLLRTPISIYEMHLGSWRRVPEEANRSLTYREMAARLSEYIAEMGFSHVELMPVMEHPFSGSWGYQVTGYFAPTSRYGEPDDFRFLVDELHRRGIGVILDWVPAHFPKDSFGLGRFDGTALFEHLDPRQGEHPEWGTYIFNLTRDEVRSFLLASAQCWIEGYHADGLRVDAVSSMLYLDYGRRESGWIPNVYGGKENLDAISFLKLLNERVYSHYPGVTMIAEESTAWPGVSRPTYTGGLGFGFKWDMGWMHDTLEYFQLDPIYRRYHHHNLTFGLMYAWSENFVLPLSHDEVVYGKQSLLSKMPGDRWQKFANLRALYGYMWARPGKKMLFMGGEFGQWNEWNHNQSLDWHLLSAADHRGLQLLVRDLNRIYRTEPALHEADCEPAGFQWIALNNLDENVIVFMRAGLESRRRVICACNFSPVVRRNYRVGAPAMGFYREILNTDAAIYSGSNQGNAGGVWAQEQGSHGLPHSISLTLPPLAVIWLEVPR